MKRLLLIPLLAATACQSTTQTTESWNPLPVLDRIEVEYRGSLRVSADDGMKIPEFDSFDVESADAPDTWQISVGVLETNAVVVRSLIGESVMTEGNSWGAGVVPLAALQESLGEVLATGAGTELSSPKLLVFTGQRATMTIANQTAFIDHFDFEPTPHSVLMDPEIGVFMDGFLMDVVPHGEDEDGHAQLEFRLTLAELVQMKEIESDYPLQGQSITIQVPVFMRQDLSGQLAMKPDQAVVLPVLYGDGLRRLLVVVRIEKVEGVQGPSAQDLDGIGAAIRATVDPDDEA